MVNAYRKNDYGETAIDWLTDFLSKGAMNYLIVKETAKIEGFTKGELKAARTEIGIKLITPAPGIYLWALPGKEAPANPAQLYRK